MGPTRIRPLSAALLAGLVLLTGQQVAAADPVTDNAVAEYRRLSHEAEVANEAAAQARMRLADLESQLTRSTATAQQAQRDADRAAADAGRAERAARAATAATAQWQRELDSFAQAALQGGVRFDGLAALLNSDSPGELLSAKSMLDLIAADNNEALRRLARASADANAARARATAQRERAADSSDQASRHRSQAQRLRDEAATTLAEAEERERLLRRQIAGVRRALDELSAAQRAGLADVGPTVEQPTGNGQSAQVVRFALAQLGKAYAWGATGPDAYDCSGLVLAAYSAAGIGLPRTSTAQSSTGAEISRDEVRAGDLIFYYRPVSHVAIAIDGSRAVHAATFGEPVKVATIDAIGPVSGIRRISQ
ncbi:C40 family peptidase [Saccharomonospora sp. NPDC046836]|uniref:C40 family peptidase n=1 Tax=Saccharomonospora sp. NPDC046836 TaxID=3156921 RepID=UPI0033C4B1A5